MCDYINILKTFLEHKHTVRLKFYMHFSIFAKAEKTVQAAVRCSICPVRSLHPAKVLLNSICSLLTS